MNKPITNLVTPEVELKINGVEIGEELLAFEWKSFVNGGYVVRGKVSDQYFRILKEIGITTNYLQTARQGPTPITFKIGWKDGDSNQKMEESRTAFISDLDQYGRFDVAQFEFVAVDPPSYLLNAGYGEGKVYKGNITSVIKEVIGDFAPEINVQVTETDDDKNGLWAMMRQDPKSFIQSMLDWSANLNPDKTHWLTTSKDMDLYIKEQSDLLSNKTHYGKFNVAFTSSKDANDIRDYHLLTNNFLSIYQNSVVTQGISTISGKFIDKKTDRDKVEIRDENTGNKLNTRVDSDKGFSKPQCKWATSINGIPEHSAGDIGIKYEEYLGGRARQLYLNMLPMVMRLRVGLDGFPKFDDPSKLGVSTLTLNWKDLNDEDFFLSGKWIVYGFHHKVTLPSDGVTPDWSTDAYLYRLDHNANAKQI